MILDLTFMHFSRQNTLQFTILEIVVLNQTNTVLKQLIVIRVNTQKEKTKIELITVTQFNVRNTQTLLSNQI